MGLGKHPKTANHAASLPPTAVAHPVAFGPASAFAPRLILPASRLPEVVTQGSSGTGARKPVSSAVMDIVRRELEEDEGEEGEHKEQKRRKYDGLSKTEKEELKRERNREHSRKTRTGKKEAIEKFSELVNDLMVSPPHYTILESLILVW